MSVVHLTLVPTNLHTLPAIAGKRTDYRDDVVNGLALRVSPAGSRTWIAIYKFGGRHGKVRRYRLASLDRLSLKAARARAKEVLAKVTLGQDPQELRNRERHATRTRRGALTVSGLVRQFLEEATLRPATAKEWRRLEDVEISPTPFGASPAAEASRTDARQWGAAIKRRSGWTANRAHQLAHRAFSWGVKQELVPVNPFAELVRPMAVERKSGRDLSVAELAALLRALRHFDGLYPVAVRLLLLTAARESMVTEAQPPEFEGLEGTAPRWTVPPERKGMKRRAKDEEPAAHLVPLSPQAAAIVRARVAAIGRSGRYLFPQTRLRRRGQARKRETIWWSSRFVAQLRLATAEELAGETVEQAVERLGPKDERAAAAARTWARKELLGRIPRWTIHGLRHTVATRLREELNVDKDVVRLLLGHGSRRRGDATDIYDHAELLGPRRSALVAWGAWLDRLEAGDVAGVETATVLPMTRDR
jgi:integrase